ncbi:DNA polymerase ligase N-terminal domain-containing protein [Planctomycetota bacterium]
MNEVRRYVVQEHMTDPHHYDFMFEDHDCLLTWQVPALAEVLAGEVVPCKKIFDHRLKYLDYEGDIPGKGRVQIYTGGTCRFEGLDESKVTIKIIDGKLRGAIAFCREDEDNWTLVWSGGL